ncbi:hypothetical protein P9112_013259 [Eukaryota sp. TZLM1-RC]
MSLSCPMFYLKTILILLSFSFVPTPTYFVFFTLISLVLSSPTSPLLSHNLYHKIFSICSFSHLYYILLSSTLSLPYFHDPSTLLPLPVSFFSTLHILTLILSIYLHSSPYFFSPHHRIPQADSVEPSLISLSFVPDTTASISVASVISFFSCGLVLIATFFYPSPWLIPLLIYGMILIIFKLRTCGFKPGYRVLLFSIISINLTFISFSKQPRAVTLLSAAFFLFLNPFGLLVTFSPRQHRYFLKFLRIIYTIDHSIIVFTASLLITLNLPTVPFILLFLLSVHYILHPLSSNKKITNLVLFISFGFVLLFYSTFSSFISSICDSQFAIVLGLLSLFLISSLSHLNYLLRRIDGESRTSLSFQSPLFLKFKSVIGVCFISIYLLFRVCLLEIVILAIFVVIVLLPIVGIRNSLIDFIGFSSLVLVIASLFIIQYTPVMDYLSTLLPAHYVDVISRYHFDLLFD